MSVPQELPELVERFHANRETYRSGQYSETQLLREFIDPFFQFPGWVINNEKGYAGSYKDVIHEDSITIGSLTKASDYCFRIGGVCKFFVDTKRPSVNIKEDIDSAFQLCSYAWSAKLLLCILTDFEEFAVYDCRITLMSDYIIGGINEDSRYSSLTSNVMTKRNSRNGCYCYIYEKQVL